MPPLYLTQQGARLEIDNRRATVVHDGNTLACVPLMHVSEVIIMGNVGLTTPALRALLAEGIDAIFLTLDGQYRGRLIGPNTPHVLLRRKQYRLQSDPALTLALAQKFVTAKLEHLRALLQRHNRPSASLGTADPALTSAVSAIAEGLARVPRTTQVSSLLGVEGAASAAYFGAFKRLLKPEWKFEKRIRRPPPDGVNILLSFGYTLLAHAAEGAVAATGLDPYAGFLHSVDYNRPSLAMDVMEEFRPLVDGVVLWACNSGQVTPADFTPGDTAERPVVMSDVARRRFIEAYERRMEETFTHPRLGQKLTMRHCLLAQARQIAEAVNAFRPDFVPMGFR